MIYLATWSDGRQAVVRAADEDRARYVAKDWRAAGDEMYDGDTPPAPVHIEHLVSRDHAGVLLTGWKSPEENH